MKFDSYFQGIRGRFIKWTGVLTLSICILAGALFYFNLGRVVREIGADFAIQYTQREKGRILAPLEREVVLCEALAKMPAVLDWVAHENNSEAKAAGLRELETFRTQFRDKSCFLALRDSGNYYFRDESTGESWDRPAYTLNRSEKKDVWFYSTLRDVDRFHLNVDKSDVRGKTMVFINTVVHSGTDRVAVAGTAMNLDSFISKLVNSQSKVVTPILVDGSGAIQAHSNPALIDSNTLSKKAEERSTIFRLLPNPSDREALKEIFAQLKSAPDSTKTFSPVIENGRRLVSVAYLPEMDWYLIAQIDLSSAIRMTEFLPLAVGMFCALCGLVLAISLLINRTILRPLDRLTASARAISAGDYSVRAKASNEDEMGELTRTFNSMLDTIERHTSELEERVSARTRELESEVKEREKAEQTARQASQAKSEFLANMSHEIRTPMNAILGFSEILANKIQDPRQKEYISAVHSSGKSLLSLINDVLDLSKVEAGKLHLQYGAVSPATILKELEMVFSQKVEEKGLTYSTEVEEGFPKTVLLDETRLRQVLLNLIGNAIKFTEHGFVQVRARVDDQAPQETGLCLIFEVHDSGIGIPSDQLENIFGAFEQQIGQSHAKYGGTGLGLTISKRLVELMGGQISVESTPGQGSIFRVALQEVEETAMGELPAKEFTEGSRMTIRFEPATILLAEDVHFNRELIKGFLEDFQIQILEACDGREAVDLAIEKQPDLVLMDIKMPVLDGIQASRLLKSYPETRSIPIVAVTASTMKSEEDQIATVCDGFLRKPITHEDLIKVLAHYLKHEIIDSAPSKEEPFCDLQPAAVYDPQRLLERLNSELLPMWNEVSGNLIVNQVLEFAEHAIAIADSHQDLQLAGWADKLRNQAMLFDMDGLEYSLAQFPAFLNRQFSPESSH